MRLLRLLSTGKSLAGMSDQDCAYHESDEALLPRFERKKNPFRATTLPVHTQPPAVVAPSEPEIPAQKPAPVQPVAPSRSATRPAVPAWVSRLGKVPSALWMWLQKRRECGFLARKPAKSRLEPAQVELRLDAVTVVRNDLSDTDIEIVPRVAGASAVPVQAVKQTPVVSREAVANTAWSRVSARVFGPEN